MGTELIGKNAVLKLNGDSNTLYRITGYATYENCSDRYYLEGQDTTGRPINNWCERGEFVLKNELN